MGLEGRETSAETEQLGEANNFTHWYPDWLVENTETGILTLAAVSCKGQTFFSKECREEATQTKGNKRKMAAKMTNREGSSGKSKALGWVRFDREARDEETKVRPASQAGGRQGIIIPCLQKPREHQQASSFAGVRAETWKSSLQVGTGLFDSNRLSCREPGAFLLLAIHVLK